ncbi:SUMF1/EgtB/PvdO family nonheme iron enzyme [Candidatus Latescibacterota bacterium]
MNCPECGNENSAGRSFCVNCGAVLGGATQVTGADAQATIITPPDSSSGTMVVPPDQQEQAEKPAGTPPPHKQETKEETLLKESIKGKYELMGKLGAGGMATVYLAREIALDRKVAIKVLPQAYVRDDDFVERFKREATVAANLEHPNIVRIYQISEDENLVFFVMSHITGGSLSDKIQEQGTLPIDDIVRYGVEVSEALSYAHKHGIVHRDLKPDNIMLDVNGLAIVTDFGIARAAMGAKLTQTGSVIGTPRYMSPEQARGTDIDGRSDIYAMGVLLYQLATGSLPFQATDAASLMYMHVHEVPEPPDVRNADVPDWLRDIILKCLAKNPDDRFGDAHDLAEALAQHQKVKITKTALAGAEKRKTGLWLGLAAAVIIIAGGLFFWQQTAQKKAIEQAELMKQQTPPPQPVQQQPPAESVSKDDLAFQQAQMTNTKQSYETYIRLFPGGAYIDEANELITDFEKKEAERIQAAQQQAEQQAEQRNRDREAQTERDRQEAEQRLKAEQESKDNAAYQQALMVNSKQSYETYLTLYSEGLHVQEARQKIADLSAQASETQKQKASVEGQRDDQAYELALNTNTPQSYNSYLMSYPSGRHSTEAKGKIADFESKSTFNENVRLGLSQYNIQLLAIAGGNFMMGSANGGGEEKPVHKITVDGFQMSMTEITQNQYNAIMGDNPSYNKEFDTNPVERVSWFEAIEFCNKLSAKLKLDPCYNTNTGAYDMSKNGFRLPTEAEWEFSCRSGSGTDYYTGDDQRAMATAGWFAGNSSDKSQRVGRKTANAWGLRDMHGNVWEWCNDWYGKDYYKSAPEQNPPGPSSGSDRVIRGGSWIESAKGCRSARRKGFNPKKDYSDIGFRIVRR